MSRAPARHVLTNLQSETETTENPFVCMCWHLSCPGSVSVSVAVCRLPTDDGVKRIRMSEIDLWHILESPSMRKVFAFVFPIHIPHSTLDTHLHKVIEEHSANGGQGEPNEDGKCGNIGDIQRMQQMRTDNSRRLAEQKRHRQSLENVPWNLR